MFEVVYLNNNRHVSITIVLFNRSNMLDVLLTDPKEKDVDL